MGARPLIIGVGGVHSNCGKTTVAAALLRALTAAEPPPSDSGDSQQNPESGTEDSLIITHHSLPFSLKRWGAIKHTKTLIYASITDNREILGEEGKDTARLHEAGAEEVLWVRSSPADMAEVLPMAVQRLSHLDGIVVEGNSAIEFLRPDIVIFIRGSTRKGAKPSARPVLEKADIVVITGVSEDSADSVTHSRTAGPGVRQAPVVLRAGPIQEGLDESFGQRLVTAMEKILKRERIEELLRERSAGGSIGCQAARRIAEELEVPYHEVGMAANALKVKIRECELGCF